MTQHHSIHVVPGKDNGWDILINNRDLSAHFKTQEEAVKTAQEMSQHEGAELVIHDQEGEIKEKVGFLEKGQKR